MKKFLKSMVFTVAFFTGGLVGVHGITLLSGVGNNVDMIGLDNGIYIDIVDRESSVFPWIDNFKESDEKPWDDYANMQYVHIAYGVENVGSYSFAGRNDLKELYLPNSVAADNIGTHAFDGCTKLKTVYFNGSEEEAKSYKDAIDKDVESCEALVDADWVCFDKGAFSQTLKGDETVKIEGNEECKALLNTISYLIDTERLYDIGSSGDDGNYNQCKRFWDYRVAATKKDSPDFVAHFNKNLLGEWTYVEITAGKNHTATDIVLNDYYKNIKHNIFGRPYNYTDEYNRENVGFIYDNFFDSFEIKFAEGVKEDKKDEEKKDNKTEEKKTEGNVAEKKDDTTVQNNTKLGVGYTFSDKNFTYKITMYKGKGKKFKGEVIVVRFNRKKAKKATVKATVKFKGKKYKVTEIGEEAFANCKVKKITIGKNVMYLGSKVFFKCKKLRQITIKSKDIIRVFSDTFTGVPRKCKVKVPSFKKSNYKLLFKKYGGLKGKIK